MSNFTYKINKKYFFLNLLFTVLEVKYINSCEKIAPLYYAFGFILAYKYTILYILHTIFIPKISKRTKKTRRKLTFIKG